MNIPAISDVLAALSPLNPPSAATPSQSAQDQFAAMLERPAEVCAPSTLIGAQTALNQMIVGTELTAKVAGSLTQSVNKLVNMQ